MTLDTPASRSFSTCFPPDSLAPGPRGLVNEMSRSDSLRRLLPVPRPFPEEAAISNAGAALPCSAHKGALLGSPERYVTSSSRGLAAALSLCTHPQARLEGAGFLASSTSRSDVTWSETLALGSVLAPNGSRNGNTRGPKFLRRPHWLGVASHIILGHADCPRMVPALRHTTEGEHSVFHVPGRAWRRAHGAGGRGVSWTRPVGRHARVCIKYRREPRRCARESERFVGTTVTLAEGSKVWICACACTFIVLLSTFATL